RYWENLVASPKHNGSTPLAKGSRLPVWPAFSALSSQRTFCSAALEVKPRGLSSRMMPLTLRRIRLTWATGYSSASALSASLCRRSSAIARSISADRWAPRLRRSSKWKCSCGTLRSFITLPSCRRRKLAALPRALSDCPTASEPSAPMTVMKTLAWARSRLTSTAVMVTRPTRGSLTSRRISSASWRCIWSPMRWVRLYSFAILATCNYSGKRPDRLMPDRAPPSEAPPTALGRGFRHARASEGTGHLDFLEDFDLVADLDVVVALDANAALHA